MTRFSTKLIRGVKKAVFLALVAWAVGSCWYIHQARQAGAGLADTLAAMWPEGGSPRASTRAVFLGAAQKMRQGRFPAVVSDLGPTRPLGEEEKVAAGRFFAAQPEEFQRFLAAVAVAGRLEEDGTDMSLVRRALAPALAAAARQDEEAVAEQLDLAEAILAEIDLPGGFVPGGLAPGGDRGEAARLMIDRVAPAYQLGEDVLTEGQAAVEKLLGRASRHYQAGEFRQAAALVGLAARLLGIEPYAPVAETPQWFAELADQPPPDATKAEAQAVVEYCEAIAMAESPAAPVAELVRRARREFEARRYGPARWWATVALAGLGMADDTIGGDTTSDDTTTDDTTTADTGVSDAETSQEETTP